MIIKFLVSLLPIFIYIHFKTKKSFHMLQQNWYNEGNRYLVWIKKNYKKVFYNYDILILLFILFIFVKTNILLVMILCVLFYTTISLLYLKKRKMEQTKLALKVTKRVQRLFVTQYLLYLVPVILFVIFFNENNIAIFYVLFGLLVYLNSIVAFIANAVNKPVEKAINQGFKNKAMKKLRSLNNLSVVGITGSYGKTSSKNILNDILNVKYNSMATPKNFNTPVGLIISINNYLDKFNDIFIAEMGAFKRGEVKQLCDLVRPKYGILTKIGTAHLDSFGSQENIQKGKFELIESLPNEGIAVLNGDDELQTSYKIKNKCKVIWVGIDNAEVDVRAINIELTSEGTTFDCVFKGDKKTYSFSTKLLGHANVYNILAGIALGKALGISINQLQLGVKKVNSIEHRLDLKKRGTLHIIDDAYNSNPVGAKMAVDVLGLMPGKKIIVTPGMIEMGDMQASINRTFGNQIAEVSDEVILIGKNQTKDIYEGLIEKKFNKKRIHILNDVKEAFPLMQRLAEGETYVLLENDLPDIFNEK